MRKRTLALVRRLDELDGTDVKGIHRIVASTVREASGAEWAIFHDLVEVDGKSKVSSVHIDGACNAPRIERMLREAPDGCLRIVEFRRPPEWILEGFSSPRMLFPSREAFERTELYTVLWKPNGTYDIAGLVVFHGMSMVGVISGSWGPPREFCEEDRESLQPLVRPIREWLTAAHCLARQGLPDEPAYLLVKPDGTIEHVSQGGRAWIRRRAFAEAVRSRVKDLDARNEPRAASSLDKAEARVARMRTTEGIRYLVCLSPSPSVRRAGGSLLTPLQLRIATSAAHGATAPEIAHDVDRSVETVREHLATVYRKLGVSSRLQLAKALREGVEP